MNRTIAIFAASSLAACLWTGAARGQNGQSSSSQESSSSSRQPTQNKGTQPAPPAAPDGSDPISRRINNTAPAQHDVEVGLYYMKKEKYDAAIDRFNEAIKLMPDYGLPYKLMGEAYEKKKFLPEAMHAYQKYMTFASAAKESEDIQKRIARLQADIQEQDKRRAAATKP